MATAIRLKRGGRTHEPYYRVVVVDSRAKATGRVIEEIGYYHPCARPEPKTEINEEAVLNWLRKGAQPSATTREMQGGASQGVGWALNEEYIYDDKGVLENPGFLDYRMPVASDMTMINCEMIEVPHPRHPYGVRGVGETPIVTPQAAVLNAVENATNRQFDSLPISPPKIVKALDGSGGQDQE